MRMARELKPETIDAVIFCMENQNEEFLFDADALRCVPSRGARGKRLVRIPEWTAAHGFALMEEFAGGVKNPVLQGQLREAMATRAGVFRRFKAALSEWPEFDREWRAFKRERLRSAVLEWFSSFLQAESLEALGDEPEETAEIVRSDFVFLQKKMVGNLRLAVESLGAGLQPEEACERSGIGGASFEAVLAQGAAEALDALPKSARAASALLFARLLPKKGEQALFCAETALGEKAGVLLAERVEGACVLLAAAVLPAFRGLGLFSQLLENAALLAEKEGGALICAMPVAHRFLIPVLERATAFRCFAPLDCC